MNLTNTQLFRGMTQAEIDQLLHCLGAAERQYVKGSVIFPEGEPTSYLGVVRRGQVLLECWDVWGNRTLLGSAGEGAAFAEAYACLPGEPLLIRVTAAEDTTVLLLHVERILTTCPSACDFHARLIRNLLTVCAQKSLQLSRRILHNGSKTIRGRLLSYFSECVKRSGSATFSVPFSRQQLADYLGVDRSAMSNELSKMRREGLIQYEKNTFTVTDGL